ncbi:MAG: hypothetical protein J6N54_10855 [Bacteroidales bacterium]|nr:hypothetical protein [Bacteroidales bacterium]
MKISEDIITQNELQNDRKTIHLYFNTEVGLYVAFGFSAFFAAHIVNVITAYSEDLHMPVALMRKPDVTELRLSTLKHQHNYHEYYRLELKQEIPLEDYPRWAASTKWEK